MRTASGVAAGGGGEAAVRQACKLQGLQKEFDFADGGLGHYPVSGHHTEVPQGLMQST